MSNLRELLDTMAMYVTQGARPGSFSQAVLANDLFTAVALSDATSVYHLPELCRFLENYAPAASHGSPARVDAWIKHHGLNGWTEISDEQRSPLLLRVKEGEKKVNADSALIPFKVVD